jgi:hypothetical protein
LVCSVVFVFSDSGPAEFALLDIEVPGIVKSGLRTVVTSEDEDLVLLGCGDGDVLSSCKRLLVRLGSLFDPGAVS